MYSTADRKTMILEAATRSFSVYGYKATTMDKVAKDANVAKGTIYTFFTDKEELFQAIMADFIGKMKGLANQALDPELPFFDNLHRVLMTMLEFRKTQALTIQLSHEVRDYGTPMAVQGLREIERAIIGFIRKEIEAALDKGQIKPCDPEVTAFVMLRLYVSLVFDWEKQSRERLDNTQIWEYFRLYLLDGLAVSP